MSPLGTVTRTPDGGYRLSYVRELNKSIAQVWAALTQPEILSRWLLSRVEVDLRIGGRFVIHFFDGKETMRGTIHALQTEHLLEYSWIEDGAPASLVRWSLVPEGEGCRLIFTHILPPGASIALATELGGGWHAILGHLETALDGGDAIYDPDAIRALETRYAALVAEARP